MLDTFKYGSVNVSAELLVGVDVIFCCGLVVEFILILWNWDICNYYLYIQYILNKVCHTSGCCYMSHFE